MPYNSNYVSAPSNTSLNIEGLRWDHAEKPQSFRKPFSKDRDRILYSKSFLRLRGKTQVFMLNHNDYIRTRLTHTLEVNQIAKTIGLGLGLNLELIEAIALGHDVGHTPFGHIGERTLDKLLRNEVDIINSNDMGFKHNLQALRLLCELEKGADFHVYFQRFHRCFLYDAVPVRSGGCGLPAGPCLYQGYFSGYCRCVHRGSAVRLPVLSEPV